METQSVGGAVMPEQPMGRAFPYRSHGVAEVPYSFHGKAFHDAASGESKEGGVHVPKLFHQILPESVAHKGVRRHQGSKAEADGSADRAGDAQLRVPRGSYSREYSVIPGPVSRAEGYFRGGKNAFLFPDADGQGNLFLCPCKRIETVFFSFLLRNSAVSDVAEASAGTEIHPQGYLSGRVQDTSGIQRHLRSFAVPGGHRRRLHTVIGYPLVHALTVVELINPSGGRDKGFSAVMGDTAFRHQGILKGTVAEHFRIETAVPGMADILKEKAVEIRRHRETLFMGADTESAHNTILRIILSIQI